MKRFLHDGHELGVSVGNDDPDTAEISELNGRPHMRHYVYGFAGKVS